CVAPYQPPQAAVDGPIQTYGLTAYRVQGVTGDAARLLGDDLAEVRLRDQRLHVDALDKRVEVHVLEERVEVHPRQQRLHVDPLEHGVEVDLRDDLVDIHGLYDEIDRALGDSLGELLQRVGHPLSQAFPGIHTTSMEAQRGNGSSAGSETWP